MSDTITELKQLIHTQFGLDVAKLEADKPVSEYGLDSLAMVELIFAIEEHFSLDFPTDLPDVSTLSGLANLVDQLRAVPV